MELDNRQKAEQKLSAMNLCRFYLFVNDMITTKESLEIANRIRQFARENDLELTCAIAARANIVCEDYSYQVEP